MNFLPQLRERYNPQCRRSALCDWLCRPVRPNRWSPDVRRNVAAECIDADSHRARRSIASELKAIRRSLVGKFSSLLGGKRVGRNSRWDSTNGNS